MFTTQDWVPTSATAADIGDDSQDTGGMLGSDEPMDPTQPVSSTEPVGQAEEFEYELNQLMETMQEALPEVPLPGPSIPQELGGRTQDGESNKATKAEEPARPVSTPCRGSMTSSGAMKTMEDWLHWCPFIYRLHLNDRDGYCMFFIKQIMHSDFQNPCQGFEVI